MLIIFYGRKIDLISFFLKVYYPGLASFPQKDIADKYHRDGVHGAMLWFDVKGGSESGIKIMNSIQRPWSLCENLGATESIITACAVMTHANMLKEDREKVGITDGWKKRQNWFQTPKSYLEINMSTKFSLNFISKSFFSSSRFHPCVHWYWRCWWSH